MTIKNARVWTGSEWANISVPVGIPNAIVSYQPSPPASATTGEIWVDSDSENYDINANDFVLKSTASATYLTQVSASTTYLTQSSASTTYARINSPSFNGTVNFTSASVVFTSASVSGLPSGGTTINSNLLYNGAMQVHQRIAVSASATTINNNADYMSADRWYSEVPYLQSYGTIAQSIENDAPIGSGFRKSLRHAYSSSDTIGSGKYMLISQKLEGQDCQAIRKGTASAKSLTLSFWVKSNLTGTYIAELVDTDNTRYVSQSYTISVSNTWEFKTVTFPPDTTGVLNNDNGESLRLNFWLRAGSNFSGGTPLQTIWGTTANTRAVGQVDLAATVGNFWQVTGVKLEIGTSATDYDFNSYGQELRECQRYYHRTYDVGTAIGTLTYNGALFINTNGSNYNGACSTNVACPVEMRTAPTVTFYSPVTGASGKAGIVGGADYTAQGTIGTRNIAMSTTASPTNATSQMCYHYIASAEL